MKKTVVMCAPFNTRSGYGDHARSIFYSIMDRDDIEIKCIDVKWGDTPRNHFNSKIERHKKLLDTFVATDKINTKPDVYIDIRIPNEFANPAKFNIGITAGVATNIVSPEFIQGCNNMDLNIVPSTFTSKTFHDCSYEQMEDLPNGQQKKVGDLKLTKPMKVLFEGIDTDVYKPLNASKIESTDIVKDINKLIKEDFVYLHVGQWTRGGYGKDRKNISVMIKCFLQAFSNHPNPPALLLKVNGADFSIIDKKETLDRIQKVKIKFSEVDNLPSIYLLAIR